MNKCQVEKEQGRRGKRKARGEEEKGKLGKEAFLLVMVWAPGPLACSPHTPATFQRALPASGNPHSCLPARREDPLGIRPLAPPQETQVL